jgi:PAS domain S-box-containing protein
MFERPGGGRVPVDARAAPLRDSSGCVVGASVVLLARAQACEADIDLARLAAIVESSDDAIISKTLEGRVTSWNAGAERIFGYEASEMIGQPITRIIPPELLAEEDRILGQLQRGEHITHYETERIGKDGRRINISLAVSPLHDKAGRIVGASKVARDVTERKQAEALQRLLVEELNHRVKNTLATVQAIASQSLRLAREPREFIAGFTGRVRSLARAHDLLVETRLQGVELLDLLRAQVLIDGAEDPRISWSGPRLVLEPQASVHMAMVLHELATNACKYGALSVAEGRLRISWEVQTNRGRQLHISWIESGGPKLMASGRRGFGTMLIEQALQGHGGETQLSYGSEGARCTVRLPLADEAPRIGMHAVSARFDATPPRSQPTRDHVRVQRVLVVEDEPLVAMDLEESLSAAGCEVIGPAGNLEQARRLIGEGAFDAALLDLNLSGAPVDELAVALTQKEKPFAFVTGYGREALPRGFGDMPLLIKPFAREHLLATVQRLLQPRQDPEPLPVAT